jgi:uncharacterized protein with PIN domain
VPEQIRFYMDEHVPTAVTQGLRRRGVDVLTVQEAGMRSVTDEEHLAFALSQGRVVFTQDADFPRLHASGIHHAGIVYAPQQTPVGAAIRGLMLIVEVLDPDDMMDHLEFV